MLLICFEHLGPSVNFLKYWGRKASTCVVEFCGAPRSLTPINEFFLVLCRLLCGLLGDDLAYHFGISQPTVSRIWIRWINLLYHKFREINIWPTRLQVDQHMPQLFKEFYPSTRCIIDATEIFIQAPSDPQAQQLTFSSYKNHNTYHTISHVSKLHGGCTSDRELFTHSGLLDLLEPGDSVMADRGFTIADLLDSNGVSLNIPPSKVGDQLLETDLVTTRRIAALRIHVERESRIIEYFMRKRPLKLGLVSVVKLIL